MQLKSLIRFPISIRRARRLLADKTVDLTGLVERPVVLDLHTTQLCFDCGRHLAALAHAAQTAGSPLLVRCSPIVLAAIAQKIHGRELLAEPHVRWLSPSKPLPEDALVLTDDLEHQSGGHVQMLIGREIDRSLPVMPYPMHPWTLRHLDASRLFQLRTQFERQSIFFAGNLKAKYGDAKMRRNFDVLSRLEILETLTERFPERVQPHLRTATTNSIVINDSRTHSISAADWLPTLARTRFFLCCPGAAQPTCHNLVEAMSVGTIPVIEYGDRVTPELTDGENAICFRGRAGLIEAMDRIDALSSGQTERLSLGAARFYDQHLRGEQFLRRLRDSAADERPRRICMPFHERNFYQVPTAAAA